MNQPHLPAAWNGGDDPKLAADRAAAKRCAPHGKPWRTNLFQSHYFRCEDGCAEYHDDWPRTQTGYAENVPPRPLRRVKVRPGEYKMTAEDGLVVAYVSQTGERSRDPYPWQFFFTVPLNTPSRVDGVADTMTAAVDTVRGRWVQYGPALDLEAE